MNKKQTSFRTNTALTLSNNAIGRLREARGQTIAGKAIGAPARRTGALGSGHRSLTTRERWQVRCEARETSASALEGSIPSLFDVVTICSGDRVALEASVANLSLTVGENVISAAFAKACAFACSGVDGVGEAHIDGLLVNGSAVPFTGVPNAMVPLIGGRLIVNEQLISPGQAVVNALHIVVDGLAEW